MEIIKGIPIPEKKGRNPVWPFASMEVGDCVRVSITESAPNARAAVAYAAKPVGGRSAKAFTTRTIDGVLHVWRTA